MKNEYDSPLVSVLIPCYNVEEYVSEAVRSIMAQTYQNLEIICIDDGSSDNTLSILQELSYQDNRIVIYKNEKNLKLIKTLNKGLTLCNGKYIARMDADDISLPTRIEKQVAFLEENNDYGIVGSYIKQFGLSNKVWKMETSDEKIRGYMFFNSPFAHPTVIFRTAVVRKNHISYNDDYLHVEDHKFWSELAKVTKMANIAEVLLYYRVSEIQVSNIYSPLQKSNAVLLKRELITDFLKKYNIVIDFDYIKVDDFKKLTLIRNEDNKSQIDYIRLSLYRSAKGKNIFMHLIFSGDIFYLPTRRLPGIFLRLLSSKNSTTVI